MGLKLSTPAARDANRVRIAGLASKAGRAEAVAAAFAAPDACDRLVLVNEASVRDNAEYRPSGIRPEDGTLALLDELPETPETAYARLQMCGAVRGQYAARAALLRKVARWAAYFDQRLDAVLLGGYCVASDATLREGADEATCGAVDRSRWHWTAPSDAGIARFVAAVGVALGEADRVALELEKSPGMMEDARLRTLDGDVDASIARLQAAFSALLRARE